MGTIFFKVSIHINYNFATPAKYIHVLVNIRFSTSEFSYDETIVKIGW